MIAHLLSSDGRRISIEIEEGLTVLQFMREWFEQSTLMADFTEKHFDFTEQIPLASGLFSNGIVKVREDIEGNTRYQANLLLISGLHAFGDYDRIMNSDFMTQLTYSLNQIKGVRVTETINGEEKDGVINSVNGSNGMLYSIPSGDINDGVVYQLQIQVNYTIFA